MKLACNVLALAIVLAVTACASPPSRTLGGRIAEYGIYRRGVETVRPDPAAPSGQSRGSSGPRLSQTTNQIPLVLGTSFGLCYELTGIEPRSSAEITVRTFHPPFARPGQLPTSQHDFVRKLVVPSNGVISDCTGYGFDHDFELVPGKWRFAVLVNGSTVLTQEFSTQ